MNIRSISTKHERQKRVMLVPSAGKAWRKDEGPAFPLSFEIVSTTVGCVRLADSRTTVPPMSVFKCEPPIYSRARLVKSVPRGRSPQISNPIGLSLYVFTRKYRMYLPHECYKSLRTTARVAASSDPTLPFPRFLDCGKTTQTH